MAVALYARVSTVKQAEKDHAKMRIKRLPKFLFEHVVLGHEIDPEDNCDMTFPNGYFESISS